MQPLCDTEGINEITIYDVVRNFGGLTSAVAFSSVSTAMKLLLVMPTTNASSERSFSALRRIKTNLCTTMTQQHLNHVMLMHVNKEKTDGLDLLQVGKDCVAGRE